MTPEISVITPAYNVGDYIFETFECLESQIFKNFEWIIIDDHSDLENQKNYELVKFKASFSVTIIRNNKNFLQAKSKNIGLKYAKGKYIKFLDADDILDKHHLVRQYELITNIKLARYAVFSPTINFSVANGVKNEVVNKSYKTVRTDNIEQLKRFMVFPFFSHCGCLFKKADLLSIDGFDETLITDEDGDLILRLMFTGMIFYPNEKSFYFYRQHLNSRVSSNDSSEKWNDRFKVCMKIKPKLINEYVSLKKQLAQRLDLLGLQSYYTDPQHSISFFNAANQVYTNYNYPGKFYVRVIRFLVGTKRYLWIKKIFK